MGIKNGWLFLLIFFLLSTSIHAGEFKKISIKGNIIPVEIVKSREEQRRGLGYRNKLPPNHGMLFIYPSPGKRIFWMKGMQFAIDIIWIYKNTVVHIEKKVPPPVLMTADDKLITYGQGIVADMVLELNSGESDQLHLGDKIHTF